MITQTENTIKFETGHYDICMYCNADLSKPKSSRHEGKDMRCNAKCLVNAPTINTYEDRIRERKLNETFVKKNNPVKNLLRSNTAKIIVSTFGIAAIISALFMKTDNNKKNTNNQTDLFI